LRKIEFLSCNSIYTQKKEVSKFKLEFLKDLKEPKIFLKKLEEKRLQWRVREL
jgi:hypothetical protein